VLLLWLLGGLIHAHFIYHEPGTFSLVHHTGPGTCLALGLFLTAVDPFVIFPILTVASCLDGPIWRALQTPETRTRLETEKMAKELADAVAVDTAMICRSCNRISATKGEPAIGRAATYNCRFCGHRTLIPLYSPGSVANARRRAGLP